MQAQGCGGHLVASPAVPGRGERGRPPASCCSRAQGRRRCPRVPGRKVRKLAESTAVNSATMPCRLPLAATATSMSLFAPVTPVPTSSWVGHCHCCLRILFLFCWQVFQRRVYSWNIRENGGKPVPTSGVPSPRPLPRCHRLSFTKGRTCFSDSRLQDEVAF